MESAFFSGYFRYGHSGVEYERRSKGIQERAESKAGSLRLLTSAGAGERKLRQGLHEKTHNCSCSHNILAQKYHKFGII